MARKTSKPALIEDAFALIADKGWQAFSFTELARRRGCSLAEVYAELPSRASLLCALGRLADEAMLAVPAAELADLGPRERIFELIMRRLEAMGPFKEGLRVIGREAKLDPMAHLIALGNLDRATAWLVDASEAGLTGFKARAARRVLMLVYARTFGVWLDDTTPDLGNTLAELDKRLQQVEQLGRWVARARRRASGRPAAEPGAEPSPA